MVMEVFVQTDIITVKVRSFGRIADVIGRELSLDIPDGSSIAELRDAVIRLHPDGAAVLRNSRSRACMGDVVVSDSSVLHSGDEVEFLPPVSGG